jgi:hypothetical protein
MPCVQKRGAAIIAARGASSAASAGAACIDHIRDWHAVRHMICVCGLGDGRAMLALRCSRLAVRFCSLRTAHDAKHFDYLPDFSIFCNTNALFKLFVTALSGH